MKRALLVLIVLVACIVALVFCLDIARQNTGLWMRTTAKRSTVDTIPPALAVRLLDVGQGDATYIRSGESRAIIDGGPDEGRFGELLDSLGLNNTTIDVVVLSHQHADHYRGLLALFDSRRHIKIRYVFENKDVSPAGTLAQLRDSIIARVRHDSLNYRDTDDPCDDGRSICTIAMRGGAKLHFLKPMDGGSSPNDRSAPVKLIGPDSASFTMWFAGDAEHDEIAFFSRAGYARNPGMGVDVVKADHHGSCNGVTKKYLERLNPTWVVASLSAQNDYGHMHTQAKATFQAAGVPWYRTDQNGTITILSPGTPGGGYTITPSRGGENMTGPSDRQSRQADCREL